MKRIQPKVLVIATSRKTRGGITSVVLAHKMGQQWKNNRCKWIETHRDGSNLMKLLYLFSAILIYICSVPFYNIVHIHVGLNASVRRKLLFAKIAKWFKKPLIIHFHPSTEKHLFDDKFSKEINKLFQLSDLLIVLSDQWIKWINEAYPNNHFNFQVLYNPCPNVKRANESKPPYILFAGTLIERKGYDRLLIGFSKISLKYPDWRLKFAGNGEIVKGKMIAEKLGIASKVDFLGWISGQEKHKIFSEAAIYCLPSWGEGFPMGVLDAIAYGIPVLTTPVGGIPDLIKNGENGYIFDTFNTDILVEQLNILVKSKEKRKAIVKKADLLLMNEFNLDKIHTKLSSIYMELLNAK